MLVVIRVRTVDLLKVPFEKPAPPTCPLPFRGPGTPVASALKVFPY